MNREYLNDVLKNFVDEFDEKSFAESEWENFILPGTVGASVYYGLNTLIVAEEAMELLNELLVAKAGATDEIGLEEELADNWLNYHFLVAASNINDNIFPVDVSEFSVVSPESVLLRFHQVICKVLRGKHNQSDLIMCLPYFKAALQKIEKDYEIDHKRVKQIMQIKFVKSKEARGLK